ncbi:amino acid adenylation domain-containing protein, partial [Pseudoalteromonas rhizosphaerae]|uniref:amino acid adenylation domain-containing protein n=1 Tax=Pseudoalteromonas rhizosphaerae TaxID=2518973 RepID=UPI00384C2987
MSIASFLKDAADKGVFLYVEDELLKYKLSVDTFPVEIKELVTKHKSEVIDFLLNQSREVGNTQSLQPVSFSERQQQSMSFSQQRLWFIDKLQGSSSEYNMPAVFVVQGQFDCDKAEHALQSLIARHEILRTVYGESENGPIQTVNSQMPVPFSKVSIEVDNGADLDAAISNITEYQFDLQRDAPLRVGYISTGYDKGILAFNMHHIASDGWSMSILVREFVTLYESGSIADKPARLQYGDYVYWQRSNLTEEVLSNQLEYWQSHLADVPQVHSLPIDSPRVGPKYHQGAMITEHLGSNIVSNLESVAQVHGLTLFMLLQGALSIALSRHCYSNDIVMGTPVANRQSRELEDVIGCFVNTLVLRTNTEFESLDDFFAHVKEVHLQAQAHQDAPFEKVVDMCAVERNTQYNPLIQTMFSLTTEDQNLLKTFNVEQCKFEPQPDNKSTRKFELNFKCYQSDGQLQLECHYDSNIFSQRKAASFIASFSTVLTNIAAQSCKNIPAIFKQQSKLPIEQTLAQCSGESVQLGEQFVYELMSKHAATDPNKVALLSGQRQMTYAELETASNQLAHYLRAHGVGAEVIVGLCVERSFEMVVGILGILKAGGAYVPLDPSYPSERLSYMVEDTAINHVICQKATRVLIEVNKAIQVISLDDEAIKRVLSKESTLLPDRDSNMSMSSLAYVIYTSGSTGQPKGVMTEHRALLNRMDWMDRQFKLQSNDKVLQKTPFSFDVSVWEFIWTLSYGAQLVIAKPDGHKDATYLSTLIKTHGITIMHFVPSMLSAFLEVSDLGELPSLRYIICSGEALLPHQVEEVNSASSNVALYNLYGPTEAAIDVSYYDCRDFENNTQVPIGTAIQNTTLLILDCYGALAECGSIGEIYIGGGGLARGYLNRPELTKERFINHPFKAHERLYKTGDLGRYDEYGNLEYLGRIDDQIKLRGHRIELGDIEFYVSKLDSVESCKVLLVSNGNEQALVCYVKGQRGTIESTDWSKQARETLKSKLPSYMLPSYFSYVESWPLTANGKLNKRALEKGANILGQNELALPSSSVEQFVFKQWTETFTHLEFGVNQSYFEVGGNSISAMRLVNKLQKALDKVVHIAFVFDNPTIEQQAQKLIEDYSDALLSNGLITKHELQSRKPQKGVKSNLTDLQLADLLHVTPQKTAKSGNIKNTCFILSPHRSGSTLLRVMLGGSDDIFAPPELELLGFETLGEREKAFSGKRSFLREGTLEAVKQIHGVTSADAESMHANFECQNMPVDEFYQSLHEWIDGRILVDKSPSYAYHTNYMHNAEQLFDQPHYIHLVRHPNAMIASYKEAMFGQLGFLKDSDFSDEELAQVIWREANENIMSFLADIPQERKTVIHYEDLVKSPEKEIRKVCDFLNIAYNERMISPYEKSQNRMTQGVYSESRMLGDVKFHNFSKIEASRAHSWRSTLSDQNLAPSTQHLAEKLGYQIETHKVTGVPNIEFAARQQQGLSFAQQRLWFIDNLNGDNLEYNMPAVFRVSGQFDCAKAAHALQALMSRHEI